MSFIGFGAVRPITLFVSLFVFSMKLLGFNGDSCDLFGKVTWLLPKDWPFVLDIDVLRE